MKDALAGIGLFSLYIIACGLSIAFYKMGNISVSTLWNCGFLFGIIFSVIVYYLIKQTK